MSSHPRTLPRSPRSCRLALALVALLITGAALAAQAPSLVGAWVFSQDGYSVSVAFRADKTFTKTESDGQNTETITGTWFAQNGSLAIRPKGSDQRISFTYRFPNANTLQLQQVGGSGIELVRKAAAAPPATGGKPGTGLNAPVPQAIQNLIASMNKTVDPDGATRITIPGWPTLRGPWGSFQYPKGWGTVLRTDYAGWVRDPRGLTQIGLSVLDSYQGAPSYEQFRDALNRKIIGGTTIRVLATWDRQLKLRGAHPDDGRARIWCYRWVHPSGKPMFGVLRVTILSRSALKTDISWGTNQCPEAEAVNTWKTTFRPSDRTAWFPIPKGGEIEPDRDGDGINDANDPDPDDPNVR